MFFKFSILWKRTPVCVRPGATSKKAIAVAIPGSVPLKSLQSIDESWIQFIPRFYPLGSKHRCQDKWSLPSRPIRSCVDRRRLDRRTWGWPGAVQGSWGTRGRRYLDCIYVYRQLPCHRLTWHIHRNIHDWILKLFYPSPNQGSGKCITKIPGSAMMISVRH